MKNFKVIDSFVFGGEIDLLKMRFDYLYDSVDYFIISESNKTFTGSDKELSFLQNFKNFEKYSDKIHYVIYEPIIDPNNEDPNPWKYERGQRDAMIKKIRELADDNTLILHGDVDEFPDKNILQKVWETVKDMDFDMVSFNMKTFYYSPLTELKTNLYCTDAFNKRTFDKLANLSQVRDYGHNSSHIENGGWHFSSFLSPEKIQEKINSFSHQEFNTPEINDLENIKSRMYNGLDVFGRKEIIFFNHDSISADFPLEFYRHDIFFKNIFYRQDLKPWVKKRRDNAMQIPLEIENLQLEVNKQNCEIVVEIGTANGGTVSRWFELPQVKTIISIDYPIGIHGGQGFEERTYVISDCLEQANRSGKEFFAINGNSKDPYLISRLEEILEGRKIDFLFIDGDHTYQGVKSDFELYEKFLKDGSIVAFHDIIDSDFHRSHGCFVFQFWEELKKIYKSKEFIFTNTLDKVSCSHMYEISNPLGGFGGIGVIYYGKKNLSLVVPIYNNVELAIENVTKTLETSKKIDEVILYSNGTTEEGNQKLLEFADKTKYIKVFTRETPIGYVKAVNEAFKLCKNELIMCLNSDAHVYSDWEQRLLPLCEEEKNGLIGPILQDDYILGCCFIVKKSVLNKVGLLNEGFGNGYHDDGELTKRILRNGYSLGYDCVLEGWNPENRAVNFPINHIQGVSFSQLDQEILKEESDWNGHKLLKFESAEKIKVLKNLKYDHIKNLINDDEVFVVCNKSGEEFEKIRFDSEIIKHAHIFECTSDMDLEVLISSILGKKQFEIVSPKMSKKLSWLAKFDDYSSMGILSQRILENLQNTEFECVSIIGQSTTSNPIITDSLVHEKNGHIGIMFAYPDMVYELDNFTNKVIYTGVDSTLGIANLATNCNKCDYILTPSEISKNAMLNLGVKKPIFVFPHGIDPKKFKFQRKEVPSVFKFLYVGELSDRKGSFHLIKAFIKLFGPYYNVELHIKSNTDMLFYGGDELQNLISKHKNIKWIKSNDDRVEHLYSECHAYVYPSRADSFGMTILEAMASGLPVISTNNPGCTELIAGKFYEIKSELVDVINHPWMQGQWGEPDQADLESMMLYVYVNFQKIIDSGDLEKNSNWVIENFNWAKVVGDFEKNILPQLSKKIKVLTLVTSYDRPHHISNLIDSIKSIREDSIQNDVYIVENSTPDMKVLSLNEIEKKIDDGFYLYNSKFNLGQRGSLLQMLEDRNLDDYDYVQFTDQDNEFLEPLSTYCKILEEYKDCFLTTGYMSKEHEEIGWRNSRFGNLCEKRTMRAGHMFMRAKDLKSLLPISLDSQYDQPHNSSWNAGLDWEITCWNSNSPFRKTDKPFILCVPGGVIHKGTDSTMYHWDVQSFEYPLDELEKLRNSNIEERADSQLIEEYIECEESA